MASRSDYCEFSSVVWVLFKVCRHAVPKRIGTQIKVPEKDPKKVKLSASHSKANALNLEPNPPSPQQKEMTRAKPPEG